MRVLDIGCGRKKTPGAIGIDKYVDSNADIICDLEKAPWPLRNDSFDVIICNHVLEHLSDVVTVMEEIHRLSNPNAKLIIEVPHFSHPDAFRDPTHRHYFTYYSFDYFTDNPMFPVYTNVRFKIIKREFKATSGINRFISSRIPPGRYEERYSRVFPAYGLYFELTPIK